VGDYVTKQNQLSATSSQLKDSIQSIKTIKDELTKQKTEEGQVLSDLTGQRDALAAKEAEKSTLLAQTQGQEAAYASLVSSKNDEISKNRSEQAAANAAAAKKYSANNLASGGSSCGGYPALWCNAAQDSLVDRWGMYNRECVSYVAWKIASTGRYMPYWGGHGNANEWPGNARADGIPVGYSPKVGAAAVIMSGYYGHIMYVERINDNGTIHVSQFNWLVNGQWGRYSEMDISASGLTYIYF
jgi:surface antigen